MTTSEEEHGSPAYAESGDSSSNDEDDGEFKSASAIWILLSIQCSYYFKCWPFFCKVDNDLGDGSGGAKAGADVPGGSGD